MAAAQSTQKRLTGALPQGKGIVGWTPLPGSQLYAEGEGLTKIYDGGYKQYLDSGVLGATRRVYRKGGMMAEVILHFMASRAAGQRLVRIKRAEYPPSGVRELKHLAAGWSGFSAQESGTAGSCVRSGKYLATVVIAGQQAHAAAAALMARKAVSKALAAEKSARKARARKAR
jgi:hypothetical protein